MASKFIHLITILYFAIVSVSAQDALIAAPIVPVGKCSRANEVYLKDGPGCPQTCKYLNQDCYESGPKFTPGCYCLPGYVRDSNNNCVEGNSFCGNCTKYEYYTENGSPCQTECATLGDKCMIVNVMASRGCYCKTGYARNARGICISLSSCPGKNKQLLFAKNNFI